MKSERREKCIETMIRYILELEGRGIPMPKHVTEAARGAVKKEKRPDWFPVIFPEPGTRRTLEDVFMATQGQVGALTMKQLVSRWNKLGRVVVTCSDGSYVYMEDSNEKA
jgi:hypothetical protein